MDTDKQINLILDTLNNIQINRMTILTGSNGKGKSLIRKQMPFEVQRKSTKQITKKELPHICKSVSMQLRTESQAEFGALSSIMHDVPWNPTSTETYHLITQLFNICEKDNKYYYIIDEPEIGMSKESELGIANIILNKYNKYKDNMYGLLVITHSEIIVDVLKDYADFINLDGYKTVEEWKTRKIIPTDFETLRKESYELFEAINQRQKSKKDR